MVQTASDSRAFFGQSLRCFQGVRMRPMIVERGVELVGQIDRHLALPDAECVGVGFVVVHGRVSRKFGSAAKGQAND